VVEGEYSHVQAHVKASSDGISHVSMPRKIFFLSSIDQHYVETFIFVWTYVRRREDEEVDHEISTGASLHPGTEVKDGVGAELL
jgi:hypothetical protein